MEEIIQSLRKIMKSVDLDTVTKAELKKKYVSEKNISKLPKEEKELFSSAVETVYMEFIKSNSARQEDEKEAKKVQSKTETSDIDSDTSDEEPLQSFKKKVKKGLNTKSYSEDEDDFKIKTSSKAKQSLNDSSDSNDEPLISFKKKLSLSNSISSENSSSDEEPLVNFSENSKKKSTTIVKNKNSIKSVNGFTKSDDEMLIDVKNTSKKRNSYVISSESEGEPLISLKKTVKRKTISCSDDSEENLMKVKNAKKRSLDFDGSEEKKLINPKKNSKKQRISCSDESDEDFKVKNSKSKRNSTKETSKQLSKSKSENKSNSNDQKRSAKRKETQNSSLDSSDSDEEPLAALQKGEGKQKSGKVSDDPQSKKNSKSKLALKRSNPKKSLDDKLPAKENQKKNISLDSSDSDEEPLITLKKGGKKQNSIDDKALKRSNLKTSQIEKLPAKENQKKNISLDSSDSDEKPLVTLKKGGKKQNSIDAKASDLSQSKIKSGNGKIVDDDSDFEISTNLSKKNSISDSEESSLEGNEDQEKSFLSGDLLRKDKSPTNLMCETIEADNVSKSLNYSGSDSEDEKLINFKNDTNIKMKPLEEDVDLNSKNLKKEQATKSISDDSEEEPLISKKNSLNGNRSYVTDSEEETLNNLKNHTNIKIENKMEILETDTGFNSKTHKKEAVKGHSSDSDEEPLISKKISLNGNRPIMTDSEEEPLNTLKSSVPAIMNKNSSHRSKGEKRKLSNSSEDDDTKWELKFSDSDEESLVNLKESKKEKDSLNNPSKKKKISPKAKISKDKKSNHKSFETKPSTIVSSESENETLESVKKKSISHTENPDVHMKSEEGSSSDENKEDIMDKKSESTEDKKNSNSNKKAQTKPSASENKLENLKKYIRAAGIRVQSYTKLFDNCKSMKSKCQKLMDLLEDAGVKGRPTLQKCKKIKEKNETKKEVSELDMSNIITSKGRSKRTALLDNTNYKPTEESSPFKRKFSRLQGIIDSEESE